MPEPLLNDNGDRRYTLTNMYEAFTAGYWSRRLPLPDDPDNDDEMVKAFQTYMSTWNQKEDGDGELD